jgi:transcriptional repressor NrdR
MHCPFCNFNETKVIDSRLTGEGWQIRRRRECLECSERFTTFEYAELVLPRVVKRNLEVEPFNEAKLKRSISRAIEKRPIPSDKFDAMIHRILHGFRTFGEREVSTTLIGEKVMDELKQLDEVAYIRFASVYRSFTDAAEFQNEVANLEKAKKKRESQLSLLLDQTDEK